MTQSPILEVENLSLEFRNSGQHIYALDKVSFTMFSRLSGTSREFDRFSVAMREIIDARVWAGIHFRTADTQGHAMGRKVAHILEVNYFQPSG